MRAIVIRQFGDPQGLKVEEVATPQPKGDEVLVAVHAAGINPSDVKNVAGTMHGTTLPRIPGRDFAGIVEGGAKDLMGLEVFGTGGGLGFTRDGTHAEFVCVSRLEIAAKPAKLAMALAGAAGVTFVTAWTAIVTVARAGPKDTTVVLGAAGGVGSAAIQIAKAQGSRVIGVVRSDEDFKLVRSMGAEHVLNSKTVKVVEAVRELTAQRGADIVFDTSGVMFSEAVEMAAMEGRIPVITAPKDGVVSFNLRTVYRKGLRVEGIDSLRLSAVECAGLLGQMGPHFDSGGLSVQAVESYPLAEGAKAYGEAAKGAADRIAATCVIVDRVRLGGVCSGRNWGVH